MVPRYATHTGHDDAIEVAIKVPGTVQAALLAYTSVLYAVPLSASFKIGCKA